LCWSWGLLSEQNKNEVQVANALDALSFAWINLLWNTALFYGLWNVPDWHNYKELLRIGETFMVRGVMRELQSVCEREKDIDKVIACIDHMKQRFTQDRSFSYGQRVFTEGFLDGFKEKIEILQQECSLSHSKREHHVILEKSIVPRLFDLSEEE
jgi:hypothetical protein